MTSGLPASGGSARVEHGETGTITGMALRLQDIRCAYGGVQAVAGVSLDIPDGAFVGLIGPNGAGKSTLLDCVSGFNRSYTGRVFYRDLDITRWAPHRIASESLIRTFQSPRLFRNMTVMSNLMTAPPDQRGEKLGGVLTGSWRTQESMSLARARSIISSFSLDRVADNYCTELSGGQERIVELARTLMTGCKAVLLDEPFAGVSPANRKRLADHLNDMWQRHGVTIVMVEHRLEWIEELCSSVYVMANGQILAQGTMSELRKNRQVLDAYLGGTA
jgi:ABC-type branched-subunit amino acid transport system ATPase component